MSKLFDIGQPNQTTPAQPVSAGMVTVRLDMLHALNEWLDYARNPFDPYHDSETREAWVWLDQARDELRAILAAPAPADPDRPSRAEVLAAVTSYAAYTRGTESTRTKEDRKEAERLEADAWEKVWTLIERLTPKAGASAGGE
jgi:hypothetical protein